MRSLAITETEFWLTARNSAPSVPVNAIQYPVSIKSLYSIHILIILISQQAGKMVKISGGGSFIQKTLRKGKTSLLDGKKLQVEEEEALEPTISEDEDDELSIASFSLRPCTNSTRGAGTGTRANIPLHELCESSSDSFMMKDEDLLNQEEQAGEQAEEISNTDVLSYIRKLEKLESSRTYRTVTTVEDEDEDEEEEHDQHDDIQSSDHCPRPPLKKQLSNSSINSNATSATPTYNRVAISPRGSRSSIKSPRNSRIKKLKNMDSSDLSIDLTNSPSRPQRKKKKKSKRSKSISVAESNHDDVLDVDLPKSFRSDTKTRRKPKKRRSSVESSMSKPAADDATVTSQSDMMKKKKEKKRTSKALVQSDEASVSNPPSLSSSSDAVEESQQKQKQTAKRTSGESKIMSFDETPSVASSDDGTDADSQQPTSTTKFSKKRSSAQPKSLIPDPNSNTTSVSSSNNVDKSQQQSIPPPPPPARPVNTEHHSDNANVHQEHVLKVDQPHTSKAEQEDGMVESPTSGRLTLQERRRRKEFTLHNLVNKFNDYESKLEKEKLESSNSNRASLRFHVNQESTTEQLLREETKKKEELQSQVGQLQRQLRERARIEMDNKTSEFQELEETIRKLEKDNKSLQQENAQHEETIYHMRMAERDMKRKLLTGAKAQGELLLLRSSLNSRNSVVDDLASELDMVKKDLEAVREEQGLEQLQHKVQNLERIKKFLSGEVERLQKELEKTKLELQASNSSGNHNLTTTATLTTNGPSLWFQKSFSTNDMQELPTNSNNAQLSDVLENTYSRAQEGSWFSKSLKIVEENTTGSRRPSMTIAEDQSWWAKSMKGFGEKMSKKTTNATSKDDFDLIDLIAKSSHHKGMQY